MPLSCVATLQTSVDNLATPLVEHFSAGEGASAQPQVSLHECSVDIDAILQLQQRKRLFSPAEYAALRDAVDERVKAGFLTTAQSPYTLGVAHGYRMSVLVDSGASSSSSTMAG
eukprot:7381978-Prymnesium_polylepis.1